MREGWRPMEKPKVKAFIYAALDLLVDQYGYRVVMIVGEWLVERKKHID